MQNIAIYIVQCFIFQKGEATQKKKKKLFLELTLSDGHIAKILSLTLESYWLKTQFL